MKKILQYLWELPQNLVGLVVRAMYQCDKKLEYKGRTIRVCPGFPGGISLADTIIVMRYPYDKNTWNTVKHEWGHSVDSKKMGWLYLFMIGIPSIIWAWQYKYDPKNPNGYYKFYTERRADKNGGVERDG